jgi:hypothetical protein
MYRKSALQEIRHQPKKAHDEVQSEAFTTASHIDMHRLDPATLLHLQRTIGNQGVGQLVQHHFVTFQSTGADFLSRTPVKVRRINYKRAKRANQHYAEPTHLGWAEKLLTVEDGAYTHWAELWANEDFNAFADAVANYQVDAGLKPDGVLGLGTWSRIGGLGEAMAGIENVKWAKSETVCSQASEERMKRGAKLASGKKFELPDDRDASDYNAILHSIPSKMLDIDVSYRGTGAAGALVYAGLGQFVSQADMEAGKLKPGAALQLWYNTAAFDLLQAGEIAEEGKTRRINNGDFGLVDGTSMVFVRYVSEGGNDYNTIEVRHFGRTETKSLSHGFWIAANVNE